MRRAFRLHFKARFNVLPNIHAFKRGFQRFNESGDISDPKPIKKAVDKVAQENVQAIEHFFSKAIRSPSERCCIDLGFSLGNDFIGAV